MFNINPFNKIIGLDISDFKIRFFQFNGKNDRALKVNSFGEITVPDGTIINGEIINEQNVIELLSQLFSKPQYGKPDGTFVNVALPEKKVFLKVVSIPVLPDDEISGAIKWTIEQHVPVSIDTVYYDWEIICKKGDKIYIIIAVAPINLIEQYKKIINKINLMPIGFENESCATARCLINQQANIKHALLIIDLGKSKTNLIFYDNGVVKMTSSIEVAGQEMTKVIASKKKLSFEDAEKAKIIFGLDEKKIKGEIKKLLEPILMRLIIKIQENINYFETYINQESKIKTFILTGSTAGMVGLPQFLQLKLRRTIIIGDPWTNVKNQKNIISKANINYNSFTTAIGLALKKNL